MKLLTTVRLMTSPLGPVARLPRERVLRWCKYLLAAALLCSAAVFQWQSVAHGDDAGTLFSDVNALRASNGLPPLALDPTMTGVAQMWAEHLASTQMLAHNPQLSSEIGAFSPLGENVAFGPSVAFVFNNFDAAHRAIMLGNFNVTGIGVASGGASVWVTEDFGNSKSSPSPSPVTQPTVVTTTRTVPPATTSTLMTTTTSARPTTTVAPVATTTATAPSTTSPLTTGTMGPNKLAIGASHSRSPDSSVIILGAVCLFGILVAVAVAIALNKWARSL